MDLLTLIVACVPFVDPYAMHSVVMTESKGNPWTINVNESKVLPRKRVKPRSYEEAVSVATSLIAQGYDIDMGLSQINLGNVRDMQITVAQAFDPCTNLYAGGTVFWRFYMRAEKRYGRTQRALLAAISAYNTGNFNDGFTNGYVARVLKAANE